MVLLTSQEGEGEGRGAGHDKGANSLSYTVGREGRLPTVNRIRNRSLFSKVIKLTN